MLARLLTLVFCFTTAAWAHTPRPDLVRDAKEIYELEVVDFHAEQTPRRFHGNYIRDIELSLQIKSTIRGTLTPGRIITIKDVQAREVSRVVLAPLDVHPSTCWGNAKAHGDYIKGQRYLVISSMETGERAITNATERQEYDDLLVADVKALLGIEGKSLTDEVEECTSLRITALQAKLGSKQDEEVIREQTDQMSKLIKKCRKSDLVELTDRFSEELVFAQGAIHRSPQLPEISAAKRRLFLLSLVETLERLDANEIKDIRTSRLNALIARHKKEGPLKIRMEEIREVAPNPSEKVVGRLHDWIPE